MKLQVSNFIILTDKHENMSFSGGMSIFENQGRLFILTTQIDGSPDLLCLYALTQDTSLVLLQNISVSFTPQTSNIPIGHDFIAVAGNFKRKL